jgi:hypothetical protein
MVPCDTTTAPKILKIFVHKFEGLYLTLIQSYNEIHSHACTILGHFFFRNRVSTLYLGSDMDLNLLSLSKFEDGGPGSAK